MYVSDILDKRKLLGEFYHLVQELRESDPGVPLSILQLRCFNSFCSTVSLSVLRLERMVPGSSGNPGGWPDDPEDALELCPFDVDGVSWCRQNIYFQTLNRGRDPGGVPVAVVDDSRSLFCCRSLSGVTVHGSYCSQKLGLHDDSDTRVLSCSSPEVLRLTAGIATSDSMTLRFR
ncbi:hypothetical protein HPB47_001474 [Ixodes persulcatus]|uniref:Uncharacterized protein n=1 Tax=Ixodes persulcatus TaxID=34615 RepID=A0AC60PNX8_IXOPE|nr:hypothetical protein HPB47_001474 [Ixodes persulcatus]